MLGIFKIRDRNLMRTPRAFHRFAIDEFGPGPTFRGPENDHRPARALYAGLSAGGAGDTLDVTNLNQDPVKRPSKALMHERRVVALAEVRIVAVATQ